MEEETIYNLIPKEYVPPEKEPRYKSQYPPNLPPTGSTFAANTTSIPKNISNLGGDYQQPLGPHDFKGLASTFGQPKGTIKPIPTEFRKKATGTMGSNVLPERFIILIDSIIKYCLASKFERSDPKKREPVPKHEEKPIMGLKTNKNFIVSNAVENILAPIKIIIAAKVQKEEVRYVEKKDFGKVPTYLNTIKSNIQNEYDMIQNMHISEANEMEKQRYALPPEEVQALRDGLKKKWEAVNKVYQEITHINKVATIGLKRKFRLPKYFNNFLKRKEGCEKELAQLEKDIERLNKQYVFVDTGY